MDLAGGDGRKFDAIELYSCFPCVPKMARRTLGLGTDVQPTVTGGLTFFGAPLNTYMTHAACAMVRKLRNGAKLGLLYGQGGFVTKHHGLVLSREAPKQALEQDTSVQAEADRNRGAVPEFVTEASGKGKVESFTVIYRPQRRRRAWRGHAAHGQPMPARWRGCRPTMTRRWRICATWTARRSVRSAISRPPTMACWSGVWGRIPLRRRPSRMPRYSMTSSIRKRIEAEQRFSIALAVLRSMRYRTLPAAEPAFRPASRL